MVGRVQPQSGLTVTFTREAQELDSVTPDRRACP